MNIEMYRIFFQVQKKHWWFVTKKNIVLDLISKHCKAQESPKILDIGCGSGLMLEALGEIGETCGMDMSDEAINFSQEIFKGQVKKGLLPDQIPYPENQFNLITALDVIEHVEQDVDSLKAMKSRLITGGKAIITVPAYMFLWSNFDDLNEHKRRYSLHELKSKLVESGFEVNQISYYNTLLFPLVYGVRRLNNLLGRDGSSDVEMPSAPLNGVLGMIFGFERVLLKWMCLPFGVSVLAVVTKKD